MKLFYETDSLGMIATMDIKAGDQIVSLLCSYEAYVAFLTFIQWNTYGDPPNSDLLRRYGYVDVLDMANGRKGSPADIVEITADLVVDLCSLPIDERAERVEWWLDNGMDE